MTAASSSFRSLTEETTLTAPHLPLNLDMTAAAFSSLSLTPTPPHLPLDLVSDILCRLCVKHLLQLCCVCKSWNSLISLDSNFSRKQLSLSNSRCDRHHLFLSSTSAISREFLVCHSPISSFFSPASIVTVKQLSQTLTGILNNEYTRPTITTCDGILCFPINESSAVLYNPSTRKSKILPPLQNSKQTRFLNLYTLVYDPITSNYKIIATVILSDGKIEVNIHILGTDYWRRIQEDFPCSGLHCKPGIFLNNTVNWVAYETRFEWVILSLDLENESYQKLSTPSYEDDDTESEHSVALGALKGCLSILSFSYRGKFSNIWIMKEYGNENSWTKLFSIPPMEKGTFNCIPQVLYISENDQLLMEFFTWRRYGLVVYDSINNTFRIPKMQNNIYDHKVAPQFYGESLISPF